MSSEGGYKPFCSCTLNCSTASSTLTWKNSHSLIWGTTSCQNTPRMAWLRNTGRKQRSIRKSWNKRQGLSHISQISTPLSAAHLNTDNSLEEKNGQRMFFCRRWACLSFQLLPQWHFFVFSRAQPPLRSNSYIEKPLNDRTERFVLLWQHRIGYPTFTTFRRQAAPLQTVQSLNRSQYSHWDGSHRWCQQEVPCLCSGPLPPRWLNARELCPGPRRGAGEESLAGYSHTLDVLLSTHCLQLNKTQKWWSISWTLLINGGIFQLPRGKMHFRLNSSGKFSQQSFSKKL